MSYSVKQGYKYPVGTILCTDPCEACACIVSVEDMCEDGICVFCEEEIYGDVDLFI